MPHTPGNWFIDPDNWRAIRAPDTDPEGDGTPWDVAEVFTHVGYDADPLAQPMANARLIAACPALLAAVERYLAVSAAGPEILTTHGVRSPAFAAHADQRTAALDDLKAAYAAAKGDA